MPLARRRALTLPLLLALLVALFATAGPARADDTLHENPVDPVRLVEQAWRLTRRHYYDPNRLERSGWDDILRRYRRKAAGVVGPEATRALINRMLGELKTSHLAVVDGAVFEDHLMAEFRDKRTPRYGMELVEVEGRLFVGGLLESGAARAAGLRVGDEVVAIDGLPAIDAENLRGAGHDPGLPGHPGYVLLAESTRDRVELRVARARGAALETVAIQAKPTNMIESVRASIEVVKVEGRKIGRIHLWHFMNMTVARILESALRETFKDCDGLVLDIRGRGGSSAVVVRLLDLFIGRRAVWKRPVVVLQHGETRSAKEIFAWRWKRAKRGPIVGETSQGACIGTIFKPLADGSWMLLPAVGVSRLTRGVELEGRGVDADVNVRVAPLPWKGDKDEIYEAGLKTLLSSLPEPRRARRSGRSRLY